MEKDIKYYQEEILDKYFLHVEDYIKNNDIVELKSIEAYRNSGTWGKDYSHDQIYYENIAEMRANLYGIEIYLYKEKVSIGQRLEKTYDNLLRQVKSMLEKLSTLLFRAKERLDYYQSLAKMLLSFSWGDF